MEEIINLRQCFQIIKKNISLIIIITCITMFTSAGLSFFVIDPVYEANTTLIVNKVKEVNTQDITNDDVLANQKLALTYGEIIKSRTVLDKVINNLNIDTDVKKLSNDIRVTTLTDTQIINVSVREDNPKLANNIANEIASVFTSELSRIMKTDNVEIIDKSVIPDKPVKPNKIMNTIIGAIIGLILGLIVTFIREYVDTKIKSSKDIEEKLSLQIIGTIPNKNNLDSKNMKSILDENYKNIRTNIEFSNVDKNIKSIVVTSSQIDEGKTTIVSSLASSFAQLDKKILIIDCDFRNPSIHRVFNISNKQGIADVLLNKVNLKDCVHEISSENLNVLTCGSIPSNPSELLSSQKMKKLLEELKNEYDYIFIDSPPIGRVTDAGVISNYVDSTIIVIAENEVDIDDVKVAKKKLQQVNAKILGSIFNKSSLYKSEYYYGYYYENE